MGDDFGFDRFNGASGSMGGDGDEPVGDESLFIVVVVVAVVVAAAAVVVDAASA